MSLLLLLIAVAFGSAGLAAADPDTPRQDSPCGDDLAGYLTWPADATAPLSCDGSRWEPVVDPYPVSDAWVSLGPAMTLHGQGRRNPSLLSGQWTATPLTPESICSATQLAVVPNTPAVGPPQVDRGRAGQALAFEVVPTVATIEMSGDCRWQRAQS